MGTRGVDAPGPRPRDPEDQPADRARNDRADPATSPGATDTDGPAPPTRVADRARSAATFVAGVAALLLVAVVVANYPDVLRAMRSEADLMSPLVVGEQAHRYDGALIMTGNYGWWPGLWVVQAVRGLPGGSVLGLRIPGIVSLLAVAALAVEARRLWSTLGGLVVVLVTLSVGTGALTFLLAWSGRAPSWWAMIALAIAVIRLAEPSTGRRRPVTWIAGGGAILLAAAVLSGDKLAWTTTVVPLLAVAVLLCSRRAWRPSAIAGSMAAGVLVGSLLLRGLAESAGYLQQVYPVDAVPFAAYGGAVSNALAGLIRVWHGAADDPVDIVAGYAGAILTLVALFAGVRWVVREMLEPRIDARAARSGRSVPGVHDVSTVEVHRGGDPLDPSRRIWMVFWSTALAAMLVAFCLSQVSSAHGLPVPRYLFGVPFAAAAVLAGLAQRRSGWWIAGPAIVVAVAAAISSTRTDPPVTPGARMEIAGNVVRAAQEHGVTRGYASYWSAYPLQWVSGNRLDMVPVGGCPDVEPYTLCPMYLHYVDQAYRARPGRKSFVLIDPAGSPPGPHSEWLTQLPPGLRPQHQVDVGSGVTMAIFDHDVAEHLRPTSRVRLPAGAGAPLLGRAESG